MTQSDDTRRESRAPREPVTTLMTAVGRINATLDLDTVPGEAAASARVPTGARYRVIVTLDGEGAPRDPVFSGLADQLPGSAGIGPGRSGGYRLSRSGGRRAGSVEPSIAFSHDPAPHQPVIAKRCPAHWLHRCVRHCGGGVLMARRLQRCDRIGEYRPRHRAETRIPQSLRHRLSMPPTALINSSNGRASSVRRSTSQVTSRVPPS